MGGTHLDLLDTTEAVAENTLCQEADYRRKHGIYYTPDILANVMAEWAVRSPEDLVLDPSYGGCAMLSAAMAVLSRLGAAFGGRQVYGVDLDPGAWQYGADLIGRGVPTRNLIQRDFLRVLPGEVPQVSVLIGNPPYVRHHLISDDTIETASQSVSRAGFSLSRRASYWAYFVLHGIHFIATNGRLALVLPAAVLQADYASEVRKALASQFSRVTAILVEERLFPDAEEESVVILAESKGQPLQEVRLVSVPTVADLREAVTHRRGVLVRDPGAGHPWYSSLVSHEAFDLYKGFVSSGKGATLGTLATVRIGAVTGANKFFVVDMATQDRWRIPDTCVRPILSHAAHLGPTLTVGCSDIERLVESGKRVRLIVPPPPPRSLPPGLRAYYRYGREAGIAKRYKCELRSPWYNVTDRQQPDGFLTYMSWTIPRLVINEAGVDCTNAIHRVYWTEQGTEIGARAIALAMMSSVAQLGVEMFGRSYGGGVLKIEPGISRHIWIPTIRDAADILYDKVTALLANGQVALAVTEVDKVVGQSIGLDSAGMNVIRQEATHLQRRRMKGRKPVQGQPDISKSKL